MDAQGAAYAGGSVTVWFGVCCCVAGVFLFSHVVSLPVEPPFSSITIGSIDILSGPASSIVAVDSSKSLGERHSRCLMDKANVVVVPWTSMGTIGLPELNTCIRVVMSSSVGYIVKIVIAGGTL